jgi:hypothetical protein
MRKRTTRWGHTSTRQSVERFVEWAHWVRQQRGGWRLEIDSLNEYEYCLTIARESPGWYRGARVSFRVSSNQVRR